MHQLLTKNLSDWHDAHTLSHFKLFSDNFVKFYENISRPKSFYSTSACGEEVLILLSQYGFLLRVLWFALATKYLGCFEREVVVNINRDSKYLKWVIP